jgi:hypothetical protein
MGFQKKFTHFLDEALLQDMVHINNLPFLGGAQVTLGISFSCVVCQLFFHSNNTFFFFLSYLLWRISIGKLCRYVGTLWV